jgi:threonine/homoserine/homoserine lactone efflux protein
MPEPSTLVAFGGVALLLAIVPGPAVLYIVGQSIGHGHRAGFMSAMGVATGGLVHVTAAVVGLSAVLASSATAFSIVKYLGAAYLVWLGLRKILGRDDDPVLDVPARPLRKTYSDGVVVNVLNPKTALFFFAGIPAFVDQSAGSPTLQMAVLGGIFVVVAFASDSLWAFASGRAAEWLKSHRRFAKIDRWAAGTIFIGLGVAAAVAHPSTD